MIYSNVICIVNFLLTLLWLSATGSDSDQMQTTDVKVLERGDDWQCPSMEERERAKNEIHQTANSVIANTFPTTTLASTTTLAITMSTTAAARATSTVTGRYTCNSTPGWRRVAFFDMTDTSYNCPTGLNLTSYPRRTCGKSYRGCSSTAFSAGGLPYSRVCGRMRGYQFGSTNAFHPYQGIDSYYVDGVSLTHGSAGSRQHIWTFAAGLSEMTINNPSSNCPCDTASQNVAPAFVGSDYFCESGLHSEWSGVLILYSGDVLWDGQDCTSTSTCCQFNNPPWFTKNLPTATTDDIELRICTSNVPSLEDVPLELIELYVQ